MKNQKSMNIAVKFSGYLSSAMLVPVFVPLSLWFTIVIGAMNCNVPNKCTALETNMKSAISLITFMGGSFGIPICTGIAVSKTLDKAINLPLNASNTSKSKVK